VITKWRRVQTVLTNVTGPAAATGAVPGGDVLYVARRSVQGTAGIDVLEAFVAFERVSPGPGVNGPSSGVDNDFVPKSCCIRRQLFDLIQEEISIRTVPEISVQT